MSKQLIAIGIDSVIISRFESWNNLKDTQLSKIFSSEEIAYARLNKLFFSQRLAVRFAAKEAFLKALQQIYPKRKLHFLTIAQAVSVKKNESGMPYLSIDWQKITSKEVFQTSISLTHQKCHATAIVIIYDANFGTVSNKLLKTINHRAIFKKFNYTHISNFIL